MTTVFVSAHIAEMQSFLDRIPTKKQNFPVELYTSTQEENPKDFLVTGEGHFHASESMSVYCALRDLPIQQVINVGVSGIIQPMHVQRGAVFSIRTSYAYAAEQPEYQSFSLCDDTKKGLDCISAPQRVDPGELCTKLGYIAPLVDRELWYLARICNKNHIPLSSYKSVLDFPHTGEKMTFQQISKMIPDHSESLYQFYKSNRFFDVLTSVPDGMITLGVDFYCTFAQSKELEKLDKSYRIKFLTEPRELIESVRNKNCSPKERTQELIQQLTWSVDPQRQQWEQQWTRVKNHYQQHAVYVKPHQQKDPMSYEFRFTATTTAEYQKVVSFLQSKNFPPADC